jgi:ribosomal RNA-processing protein 9
VPVAMTSLHRSQPFGSARASSDGGHTGEILCVAASEDGRWLVSGGRDKIVGVWKVEDDGVKWTTGMRGHKDAITVSTSGAPSSYA